MSASRISRTPKLLIAEPKNTGVCSPCEERFAIEIGGSTALASSISLRACANSSPKRWAIAGSRCRDDLVRLRPVLAGAKTRMRSARMSKTPPKRLPMPTGQVKGTAGMPQHTLDLVDQLERLAHFAVELVDERDDRRVARAADFEQPQGLRFDTVRGVDHHQRGIHRRQHAIGVLGEILVARGVEQVDARSRDTPSASPRLATEMPRCFSISIQSEVAWRAPCALSRSRDVNRTREEQQLLGERGLARIGVRDDGEGAPAPEPRG